MGFPDFSLAGHTIIVSDIHLTDVERSGNPNPLWKLFKLKKHFIDDDFRSFLEEMRRKINGPIELILNGDIFDFDSVMVLPEEPSFKVSWLEAKRGLFSEEAKSRFKIKIILDTHPVWIQAIRDFVLAGNRVIFIIGNHDMELHWTSVRQDILNYLNVPSEQSDLIRFCEWFYISNKDTLVEHGNQYDAYCVCSNPIHPLIKKGTKVSVRLPFGNLAGRYMINGIGLMNPYTIESYIKDSIWDYVSFYYHYVIRTQPLLPFTWFWSAMVTMVHSMIEGFLPPLIDPLTVDARIEDIAKRSNSSIFSILALKVIHVHPAIFNPFKIIRELWLDRAILLCLIVFGSFQFFSFLNVFANVSYIWFVVPLFFLIPIFIFYARSVRSEVDSAQHAAYSIGPLSARITKVKRIVYGHTHLECHQFINGIEMINTGTWSPAFHDIECTKPYGRRCFAWIRPSSDNPAESSERVSELYEWKKGQLVLIPKKLYNEEKC